MTSDKLSDRLKGMLLETTSAASNAQHPPSPSRPLIEVVRSEGEEARGGSCRSNAENVPLDSKSIDDDDDDDDGPPPISFHGATTTKPESSATSNDVSPSEGHSTGNSINMPSLAEQLLADATEAKQKQQQQKTQKEQRRAKKSTFGLKKGFLNSSSNGKKAGKKSGASRAGDGISKLESEKKKKGDDVGQKGGKNNLIYELDNDGNMIPSSSSTNTNNKRQPTKSNPLHLPEVQSAMLSQLQSNSPQWATPDLLDSIPKQHPNLAQGMNNPRYMKALQDMQSNPKETLDRLKKSDPEIVEWLMEFCGVMGEHFCRMGEGQQGRGGDKKKEQKGVTTAAPTANDKKVREMGPLEKKALSGHKKMQTSKKDAASTKQSKERQSDSSTFTQQPNSRKQGKDVNPNNGMDDQVSSILADDELRSILMDPKMQQIMEECTVGNKLRFYMGHEEYGPKLRKLMEAGLIRMG